MSKSILVTGGTKGIGRAIIERFAKEGFDIYTCSRNESELLTLKQDIESRFPDQKVWVKKADLSKKEEVLGFATAVKAQGIPDVLINNTGVFLPGAIHSEQEGNFELMMETNLYSAYYLTRAFTDEWIKRKSGHIYSIGSIAGLTAYANGGSYAISKWAMLGFTKCLRQELMPYNIKVTSILPGATYTASWEGVDLPIERFIKAEDVAETVWASYNLSPFSVVEEIVIRPQLGDL
ncbi:short-chain dehydrogenase [Rhodonellum psychrophilum GCM71 = DSM 17998]|uniref:Short-chain dehydrogenase n=2 Tax=Rhodonellum TaxID=336827 RepID=U5C641_9BACT|nr:MULTISPECIES: SDR family oxidoreductase [Rhodonellum]ERM84391.1 short-chain dehydrogenase [Rhodonellum psychrophilum GCM71 = DSM 17998]MDO9551871.1 SDR family oxidoreductase [Rhodonellum sp.]SDZ42255.1 Short-chain dehydrogenase [Rhodonellum ikkaensis]